MEPHQFDRVVAAILASGATLRSRRPDPPRATCPSHQARARIARRARGMNFNALLVGRGSRIEEVAP